MNYVNLAAYCLGIKINICVSNVPNGLDFNFPQFINIDFNFPRPGAGTAQKGGS